VRASPCFSQLQRYDIVAGRTFLARGYRRIRSDPATRTCVPDGNKSSLLQDRIPIGLPVYPVLLGEECTNPGGVAPLDLPQPNPCFERWLEDGYQGYTQKTSTSEHISFSEPAPSTVVRFANPDFWTTLGVSHLTTLQTSVATADGGIPTATNLPAMPERGLTITLSLTSGYARFQKNLSDVSSIPCRLQPGFDDYIYLVDKGVFVDSTGSTRANGQVLRFNRNSIELDSFLVH
jgi:hypothetical protein